MPAPQQPTDLGTKPPETVVEFGPPPEPRRSARRWSIAGFARGLAGDRRLVPLSAALGAVAAFASVVSEWQVTRVDGTAFGGADIGPKMVPADLADLGSFGTGYLIGLVPLIAALVLTMFGPVAGRGYARLAGLSVGGTLLGLLLALTSMLGSQSRVVSRLYTAELSGGQLQTSYSRGLWCALFAVVAAMLALYLAGRHLPPAATGSAAEIGAGAKPAEEPAAWSWRRPRPAEEETTPDVPFELTVTSTKPFTTLSDDRDKPDGS